jgi:hypothetical protein
MNANTNTNTEITNNSKPNNANNSNNGNNSNNSKTNPLILDVFIIGQPVVIICNI